MDRVFFLHIPKTGGSSLSAALCKKFPSWEIFPWRHSRLDLFNSRDLLPFRFFHGHFSVPDLDYVPAPVRSLTLLREPRARLVSLYHYWQSLRWDAHPRHEPHHAWIAKSFGLRTFLSLRNPSIRQSIDNALVQAYLSYPLRGRNGALTAAPATIVDDALEALDGMTVFGILERFEQSLTAIGAALETRVRLPTQKVRSFDSLASDNRHERIEPEGVTPEIEALLESHTELDRLFYARAIDLFDRKFGHCTARPTQREPSKQPTHDWGDWINFGSEFHIDGVKLEGWSDQESWGVWSVVRNPSLRIGPLAKVNSEIRLTLAVRAAVFDRSREQTITVIAGDRPIETWRFTLDLDGEKPVKVIHLPSSALDEEGYLDLAFHVDRPISLAAAGISPDARELGLGLENIRLECIQ